MFYAENKCLNVADNGLTVCSAEILPERRSLRLEARMLSKLAQIEEIADEDSTEDEAVQDEGVRLAGGAVLLAMDTGVVAGIVAGSEVVTAVASGVTVEGIVAGIEAATAVDFEEVTAAEVGIVEDLEVVRQRGESVFAPDEPAVIDGRLKDNSQDALVASFRGLQLSDTDLPLRPDFGTVGRPITLRTNFFPIRVPKGPLFEYDVALNPPATNKRLKRRIFQIAEQTPDWAGAGMTGKVAHDHSSKLIAAIKLPEPLVIRIAYTEEDDDEQRKDKKEYTLTIRYIQDIETQSLLNYLDGHPQYRGYDIMPVVTALNLILAAHPNRSVGGGVMIGRNKFFHPSATSPPVSLGGGLEAWRGFYSSVRPAHKQLMVNVNVCTTAFYSPGNLAERMMEFEQASFGARASAFAKGVRVKTMHLGYRKTVKTVAKVNARQHSFQTDEYGKVTVEQYFKRMCTILENQPFRGKLLDEHTAKMILVACQPPNVNAQAIVGRGLDELGFRQGAAPMDAFGIRVGNEMAVVPGRILNPPTVRYSQGAAQIDDRASWNLRNVRFSVGAKLEKWAVLLIKDGNPRDEYVSEVGDDGRQSPPAYAVAQLPRKSNDDPIRRVAIQAIRTALMGIKSSRSWSLLFCPTEIGTYTLWLKHLCDVYLDVATVCVHAAKIRKERGQPQYFANVALKVNMKLGGVNHELDQRNMAFLNQMPTMLVGMDVTHPGLGTVKGTPLRIQESKKEMVTDLASMIGERIAAFKARNNNELPARILVYRDGVSEGQFPIVVAEEMPEIKKAFRKFSTPQKQYSPKLTIVVCGKRHHTRFYPTEAANAAGDGNPKPGTVVDRGATAVYEFDFYLQAHGGDHITGLQGTTRPTHYYVVHDEIGFGSNQLQGLTNDVSYMFARATKAVSLVSPAYYADLACERGRCYLHALLQGISDSGTTATSGAGEEQVMSEAQKMWRSGVGNNLKETMFYL
ncbi:Protein argonaute MEL1 [Grifola frondosa]|uniref:Protein argonaute MEL1 n=1 Tax=Grifola frondosa TaxID=5627 RepID=A0A1C7LQ59_GRIFR|nr:Protein argonaute MEL1 [Grifola frondosa]